MGAVSFLRFLGAVLLSLLAAVVVLALLSFVVMRSAHPAKMIFPCASAAMLLGAWCAGLFGASLTQTHSKLFGMLCYAAYLLFILLGSFFFAGTQISWIWRMVIVFVGAICAFLASCFRRGEGHTTSTHASIRRAKKKLYRRT